MLMNTKQVVVDGLLTRYAVTGTGKPVLLLHGWGDSLETWTDLTAKLSGQYKVITLDLPGFGQTQAPKEAWGLSDYAQFTYHFLAKIEVNQLYALGGHSNGGAVAISMIAHGLASPHRLLLLASAGIRSSSVKKHLVKAAAKSAKLVTAVLPKATRQRLRNKAYSKIGSDFLLLPNMQETFKKIISEDVRAQAHTITTPTLIIYGANDASTPPAHGELFKAAIIGSRLEILPGAGHFLHHDNSLQVSDLVKEFLA
jgi:pimeloyl-ACP methyl ester carboxylesterase